ncbi:hypothetical protein [Sphingomonas sp.]|uniref:hypothetical protein n=1 Tax=Sphingomonas sp. TaxID=28214 RepID=UPI002C95411C|nr:hypothetical protein [Sphingomonas sp.]HWK36482.1 hypothetical protein [Sphingomonas sp.]
MSTRTKLARRFALLSGLLMASAACFAGDPAPALGRLTISGTVAAADGAALDGGKVIACSAPYKACKTQVEAPLRRDGTGYAFTLTVPDTGPYQIVAWKDVDGNNDASPGDYLGMARDGAAVTAPAALPRIAVKRVEGTAATVAAAGTGSGGAVTGSWSQSSTTRELVLMPKIKFQPSLATGYGTNLGGTFGAGSATNTVIVNESTSVTVNRSMTLTIRPDGGFSWRITRSYPEGSCTKTVNQVKEGRATASGGSLTFAIERGTEQWSGCGKAGSGAIGPSRESYSYRAAGAALTISGSGGVNWAFHR